MNPLKFRYLAILSCFFAIFQPVLATGQDQNEKADQETSMAFVIPPKNQKDVDPKSDDFSLKQARYLLGKKLFFETKLSAENDNSCASCHKPERAFSDGYAKTVGRGEEILERNSPSLINRFRGKTFMWDGRFESLKQQALDPIRNPKELGLGVEKAVKRIQADPEYRKLFAKAWPKNPEVNDDKMAESLAEFVKAIRIPTSPSDAFVSGQRSAMNEMETHGFWIFSSKGGCWKCHNGKDFTDDLLHNTGVGAVDGVPMPGQMNITGKKEDNGKFKTPTLRGLVYTAPYMHDGRFNTLKEVVEFYSDGGTRNSHTDPLLKRLDLTTKEKEALVAYLKALSKPYKNDPGRKIIPVEIPEVIEQ